jgi:hypothetical protein
MTVTTTAANFTCLLQGNRLLLSVLPGLYARDKVQLLTVHHQSIYAQNLLLPYCVVLPF